MDSGQLTWITNFIWGIADDVLHDLYVRGKYRDVILPMTVIRRLDAVLEPTEQAVGSSVRGNCENLPPAVGDWFRSTPRTASLADQSTRRPLRKNLDGLLPGVEAAA